MLSEALWHELFVNWWTEMRVGNSISLCLWPKPDKMITDIRLSPPLAVNQADRKVVSAETWGGLVSLWHSSYWPFANSTVTFTFALSLECNNSHSFLLFRCISEKNNWTNDRCLERSPWSVKYTQTHTKLCKQIQKSRLYWPVDSVVYLLIGNYQIKMINQVTSESTIQHDMTVLNCKENYSKNFHQQHASMSRCEGVYNKQINLKIQYFTATVTM